MSTGTIEYEPKRYEEIATAIGHVCLSWREIEEMLHRIVLRLAEVIDPTIEHGPSSVTFHIILSECDLSRKIASAKALAFIASGEEAGPLFVRTRELLNLIDKKLRLERNKYIHEEWIDLGERIVRGDPRARVSTPQSHSFALDLGQEKSFDSIEHVYEFASVLEAAAVDLDALRNHIWTILLVKKGDLKTLQNLPETWSSLGAFESWKRASHTTSETE
tara:strand:+ start:112 stop:768 length:657 start_codon:yes stop_codon:yes gene_type:complete